MPTVPFRPQPRRARPPRPSRSLAGGSFHELVEQTAPDAEIFAAMDTLDQLAMAVLKPEVKP